jgi:hypothetical protein
MGRDVSRRTRVCHRPGGHASDVGGHAPKHGHLGATRAAARGRPMKNENQGAMRRSPADGAGRSR